MVPVEEMVFRPCSWEGEVGFTSQVFRTWGTAALETVGIGLDGVGMAMGGLSGWAPGVRAGRRLRVVFFHRLAPFLASVAAAGPSLLVLFRALPVGLLRSLVRVGPSRPRLPSVSSDGCCWDGRAFFCFCTLCFCLGGVTPSPWSD